MTSEETMQFLHKLYAAIYGTKGMPRITDYEQESFNNLEKGLEVLYIIKNYLYIIRPYLCEDNWKKVKEWLDNEK